MLVEGTTVGGAPSADELADEMDAVKLEEDGDAEPAVKPTTGAGRKIPAMVRDWDDPRLFTLVALGGAVSRPARSRSSFSILA